MQLIQMIADVFHPHVILRHPKAVSAVEREGGVLVLFIAFLVTLLYLNGLLHGAVISPRKVLDIERGTTTAYLGLNRTQQWSLLVHRHLLSSERLSCQLVHLETLIIRSSHLWLFLAAVRNSVITEHLFLVDRRHQVAIESISGTHLIAISSAISLTGDTVEESRLLRALLTRVDLLVTSALNGSARPDSLASVRLLSEDLDDFVIGVTLYRALYHLDLLLLELHLFHHHHHMLIVFV